MIHHKLGTSIKIILYLVFSILKILKCKLNIKNDYCKAIKQDFKFVLSIFDSIKCQQYTIFAFQF